MSDKDWNRKEFKGEMKMKRLSYILLAAMLVAVLAVSCTAEVIDDSLVAMVRFTDNVGSRALEVSREDVSVGELYWKYDAAKVSGPASGAVTGKYLGQGLSKEAGPFSLGDWNFTLYGYKDKECKTLMYKGTGTGTVEKGKTNAIRISVEPQMTQEGTGSLHISKSIQLTKDGVVVKGSDGSTTYTATSVVVTRLSDGSEVNVNADDSYFWKADGITSGSYKVVVAFVDDSTGIIHAENTAYVNVFDGLTTVIKGTLDEVTSSISFDANFTEGRISETNTVSPDTDGNVSASFGFSPVSNESSTGNDVLGTTIEGSFTGSGSIELNVYGSEGASSRFSAEDENSIASAGFDINLSEGLAVAENGSVTITTYIQPGLTGEVKVVYRDEEGNVPEEGQPTGVSYEVETGKLRFTTTHFSEYYVVSDSVAENTTSGKRYATLQDAVDYARDGEEIKLLKNVDTVESLVFSNGAKLILDLNGHTVKNIVELDPRPRYFTVVSIDNESSVTLKNGTIQAMDKDCYAINVIDGKLVIESGKYIGNISVVQVQKGTLEILRGEFSLIQTWPTTNDSTGCLYTINCIDANYKDGSAIVSIKGGTFRMFNPQDCYAEGAHTNFVAEGYGVTEMNGVYTVMYTGCGTKTVSVWDGETVSTSWYDANKSEFSIKTASELAGLASLVNKGTEFEGKTVCLECDIDLNNQEWTPVGLCHINENPYNQRDDGFYGFRGVFDGKGHSVANLKIDKEKSNNTLNNKLSYVGFFGVVKSGASIKNLILENVDIVADSFIGSFVGYLPNSQVSNYADVERVVLSNLKLCGKVSVLGATNIGGVIGRSESTATKIELSDIIVDVLDSSLLFTSYNVPSDGWKGNTDFVGGLIGAAYCVKEDANTINNCSIKGLTIKGQVQSVGGFAGLFGTGMIKNSGIEGSIVQIAKYEPKEPTQAKNIGAFVGSTLRVGKISFEGSNSASIQIYIPVEESIEYLVHGGYVGTDRSSSASESGVVSGLPSSSETIKVIPFVN